MRRKKLILIRGVFLLLIFGPICLIASIFASLAALNYFFSGWLPQDWFSDNAADWIWGFGMVGGAAFYFKVLFYGVIAALTGRIIKWGFQV